MPDTIFCFFIFLSVSFFYRVQVQRAGRISDGQYEDVQTAGRAAREGHYCRIRVRMDS